MRPGQTLGQRASRGPVSSHLLQVVVALPVLVELLLGAEAGLADLAAEPALVHLVRLGVSGELVTVDEVTLVTYGAHQTV